MRDLPETIDPQPARVLLDRHLEHHEPYRIVVDSLHLTILPGVFCPAYTRTSAFLAAHVRAGAGDLVLDMFAGSGYQGLLAARRGATVVCVDIQAEATRCATLNAHANGLADRMTTRTGDLFDPVPERFDVVIANPPLLPGAPETPLEAAVFDVDLVHSKRFIEEVGDHLTVRGRAYLIATDAHRELDVLDVPTYSEKCGLQASPIATLVRPTETYTVFELKPAMVPR